MAQPLRIEFDGALYLVTGLSHADRPLARDEQECQQFLQDFAAVAAQLGWHIYAWCLLPDSYSVVLETPHGDLHLGMRQFTGTYTRHVSNEHQGHLFRSPYTATLVDPVTWLLPVCRHVVIQPVICSLAATPDEWRWSSFQRTVQGDARPGSPACTDLLLARFGSRRNEAAAAYADYVAAGIGQPWPLASATAPGILGDSTFLQDIRERLLRRAGDVKAATALLTLGRPSLAELFGPDARHERRQLPALVAAAVHYGYSLRQIAATLGVHYTTVSRYLRAAQKARPGSHDQQCKCPGLNAPGQRNH